MRPLIVGEAPNRSGQGKRANTTFTGGRIAKMHPLANELPRTNLLREWPGSQGKGSAFPLELAKPAAARLLRRVPSRVPLLMIGTRVAAAFGMKRESYDYLAWYDRALVPGGKTRRVAVCPHPSGIVLWWNDPQHVAEAEAFFERIFG